MGLRKILTDKEPALHKVCKILRRALVVQKFELAFDLVIAL